MKTGTGIAVAAGLASFTAIAIFAPDVLGGIVAAVVIGFCLILIAIGGT